MEDNNDNEIAQVIAQNQKTKIMYVVESSTKSYKINANVGVVSDHDR